MSSIGSYLDHSCSTPLLSAKQEILLARQVQEGQAKNATDQAKRIGRRAKDRLILANMRMVVSLGKKYAPRCKSLTLEDLLQEGVFGLNRAAELFDPTRGYKFSTYSHRWIEHAIGRAIAAQDATIRLPVHVSEAIRRFERAVADCNGQPFDRHEKAAEARTSIERIEPGLMVRSVATLDHRTDANEEGGMINTVASPGPEPGYQDELGVDVDQLQRGLLRLPPDERNVIVWRYGLFGRDPHPLEAIGKTMGISRESTRKLKDRAMRRLKITLETS